MGFKAWWCYQNHRSTPLSLENANLLNLLHLKKIAISCVLFGIMSKHISPRVPIFAGSMTFILMPLVLIPGSPVLFLIITGIIFFGRTLIDYAVPTLLLYAVESEIAGPYNAYRMILHSGGTLIATGLSAVLPANVLLITAAVSQLISGTVFFSHKILKDASPLRIHDQKKERQ